MGYNSKVKIYILGSCAGGKSTLAKVLASEFNLSYHILDDIFIDYPKITPEKVPFKKKDYIKKSLQKILKNKKGWIIEGIYCLPKFLKEADIVILVKQPFLRVIIWQWKRLITDYLEKKRFGVRHNLILSQIIFQQYFGRGDFYNRVGIGYPTYNYFKKFILPFKEKVLRFKSDNPARLIEQLKVVKLSQ